MQQQTITNKMCEMTMKRKEQQFNIQTEIEKHQRDVGWGN